MTALSFAYVNHNGIDYTYKVIPITMQFGNTKLYSGSQDAWCLQALVLTRNGEVRNVIRTFSLVRMRQIQEVPIETG